MSDEGFWVNSKKACSFYGVSPNTLRKWADNNQVIYKRNKSNQRNYFICKQHSKGNEDTKQTFIYVRVSSQKQKDDLERQSKFLSDQFPDARIIKDIGSGLNYKRKGLLKLLDYSNKGIAKKIIISSKDRLCRFGFELLEWQFLQNNTELMVLEQIDKSPEQEFTEDILAILQVFACRWNGKRRYCLKNKDNQIKVKFDTKETVTEME